AADVQEAAAPEAHEAQADVVFGVNNSPVNGKIFFESYDHETNNFCSASVINTPSKRVIVTAAHCVYNATSKHWQANAVFVPNYNKNAANPAPLGIWPVRTFRVFDSWILNTSFSNDIAFGTLYNGGNSDLPIATVTGGHGITWGGSFNVDVTIFGYPINRTSPANGRYTMLSCATRATRAPNLNEYVSQDCWFLGGASGGPWLQNYNPATGTGQLRSITTSGTRGTGNNWGPYFDSSVKTLMDKADSDW
ncbi:MAG: trypsin-like peptidase domain-containing protein, partial [Actinomycetaceae bacterium]|nr:trypsin-like peptidase domain-containing protein [Actinomycetaceae bacterium]